MKFKIRVQRTEVRNHVFEVEADTQEEAEEKVMEEEVPGHDFRDDTLTHGDEWIISSIPA